MPYCFLDHTADVAFEAWGTSLEELFQSAAAALLHTMIENPETVRKETRRVLRLENPALDLLLFDLLQELIYFKDAEGLLLLPRHLAAAADELGWRIEGELAGEALDPERHEQGVDVKAVTLHRFEVGETPDGWRCHVILDV
jgi:SHS2 domain-containing protein